MGSTGASERSLGSGLIPQWMKNRIIDNRLDLEESAAFSPPNIDDSFFYIRYPRGGGHDASSNNAITDTDVGYRPITEFISDRSNPGIIITKENAPQKIDFSKHTMPCQQFIPNSGVPRDTPPSKPKLTGPVRIKSNGTDDGFKGEGAACGTSIIQVANQMVLSKNVTRGFNINDNDDDVDTCDERNFLKGFDPVRRRGSRSLPSSPNASPKTGRKKLQNRYFTGAFIDKEKFQGGWLLTSLLGQREIVASKSSASIVDEANERHDLSVPKASGKMVEVSNVNMEEPVKTTMTTVVNNKKKNNSSPSPSQLYRAKPSELREMNFWSPTSM